MPFGFQSEVSDFRSCQGGRGGRVCQRGWRGFVGRALYVPGKWIAELTRFRSDTR